MQDTDLVRTYDMRVISFLEKAHGNGYLELHAPGSFYETNAYAVRAVQNAGGITTPGSDAPVQTRDPRPFGNMAHAITQRNPAPDPTVDDVIAAHTVSGAPLVGFDHDADLLEIGKSSDFIVLGRDIVQLAAVGRTDDIANTRVTQTRCRGKRVYAW